VYSRCWWESLKVRDIFLGLGVNRRIILISIFEIGWGWGVSCLRTGKKWQALQKEVMNLRVP